MNMKYGDGHRKKAQGSKRWYAIAAIAVICVCSALAVAIGLFGAASGDAPQGSAADSGLNRARQLLRMSEEIERLAASAASPDDSLRLLQACSSAGDGYRVMGDDARATGLYTQAIGIAEAMGKSRELATLYNNVFTIYYHQGEYERAADLLDAALGIYREAGDSLGMCRIYNNIGLVSYERGMFGEALSYTDKALQYTSPADCKERASVYTNRGEIFYRQGLYTEAERELDEAVAWLDKSGGDGLIQTYLNAALVKARLNKRQGMERMLERVNGMLGSMPPPVRSNSYRQLADICFTAGDSLAGLRQMLAYEQIDDSLRHADKDTMVHEMLVAYDTDRLRQRNEMLRQTVRVRGVMTCGAVLSAVALGALAFMLIRRIRLDRRKSRLIARQQEQLRRYEQAENERKQRELSMEIDHKARQLTSYTLNLAGVNEFCAALQAKLREVRDGLADGGTGGGKEKTAALEKKLDEVMHSLQHYNDKPVAEDFRVHFDEVHPDFLRHLSQRHPQLTNNDLRLCAYLHLGMSTKEIAALTYREVRSVESSRNRLRKKLGLPQDYSLQDFLKEMESEVG